MQSQYGPILEKAPDGLVPKEQWPEYDLRSHPVPLCGRESVGSTPKGVRWWLWPLCFEEYVSDTEPDLAASDPKKNARSRLVVWRRFTRLDHSSAWRTFPWWRGHSRFEGFGTVTPEYWKQWSESARRYRKKWLTQYLHTLYTLERTDFDTFRKAYVGSTVSKATSGNSLYITEHMHALNPSAFEFIVAQRISDGTIRAGLGLIHSPSTKNSYYASGFYHESVADDPLMTGLIDEWYRSSLEHGYTFLHFGEFWRPGSPKEYKGFSIFKSKFGLFYILYPRLVARFVRGTLLP